MAERKLRVEIRANAANFARSFQRAEKHLRQFEREAERVSRRTRQLFGQVGASSRQMGMGMAGGARTYRQGALSMMQTSRALRANVAGTADRINRSNTRMSQSFVAAGTSSKRFSTNASRGLVGVSRGLSRANTHAGALQGRFDDYAGFIGFQMLGRQAQMMGLMIAGAGALSVKAFMDMEDTFALVRKTVDGTESDFTQLNNEIRQLATEVPIAVTELNEVASVAGQLGVPTENIAEFTQMMAEMGVATNLTAEQSAISFARIAAVMQESLDDDGVGRMTSAVVDLGNNFAAREDEIVRFSERIAAAGQVVNMTSADIAAFSTAFTAVGVRAERGGTAFQRVLFRMMDAVQDAGDDLELIAETADMTAQEFADAWRSDPAMAMIDFIEGLNDAGEDANRVMSELFGNNVRTSQSFLALAGAGELGRDALVRSRNAFDENNARAEEAQERFSTLASQFKTFSNRINEVAISIGANLAPIAALLFEHITELVEAFGSLPEPVQRFAMLLGTVASAAAIAGGSMLLMVFPMRVLSGLLPQARVAMKALQGQMLTTNAAMRQAQAANAEYNRVLAASGSHAAAMRAAVGRSRHEMTLFGRATERGRIFAQNFGAAARTMGRAIVVATWSLLKMAAPLMVIWGLFEGGRALMRHVNDGFIETSKASDDLAESLEITTERKRMLDQGMSDVPRGFVDRNEELIGQLREIDLRLAEISVRQIAFDMALGGADEEEILEVIDRLEWASDGREFNIGVNTDDLADASAYTEQIIDDLSYMQNQRQGPLTLIDKDTKSSLAELNQELGRLFEHDPAGALEGLADSIDNIDKGWNLKDVTRSVEDFARGLGASEAAVGSLGARVKPLRSELVSGVIEPSEFVSQSMQQVVTSMAEAGDKATYWAAHTRDAIMDFMSGDIDADELERRIQGINNFIDGATESTDDLSGSASVAAMQMAELGYEAEDINVDAIERLRENVADLAESSVGARFQEITDSLSDMGKEFQKVGDIVKDPDRELRDDEIVWSFSDALDAARHEVEDFIEVTNQLREAGFADREIGFLQEQGIDAMVGAIEEGTPGVISELGDMFIEMDRAMVQGWDDLMTAEHVDPHVLSEALGEAAEVAMQDSRLRAAFADLGIDKMTMEALENMGLAEPVRRAVWEILEDPDGMRRLGPDLAELIFAAKHGPIDDTFSEWEGNFRGQGAKAVAGLIDELGLIDEGIPTEMELELQARTVDENGRELTVRQLMSQLDPLEDADLIEEIEIAISVGDRDKVLELLEEVARDRDVRIVPEVEKGDYESSLDDIDGMIDEKFGPEGVKHRDVLLGTEGDTSDAEMTFSDFMAEERGVTVDADAQTDEAGLELGRFTEEDRKALIKAGAGNFDEAITAFDQLTGEQRQALIDAAGGDKSVALAFLASITEEERQALIDAEPGAWAKANNRLNWVARSRETLVKALLEKRTAQYQLNQLTMPRSMTITAHVRAAASSRAPLNALMTQNADGNIYARSFARGSEDHRAQIARPGEMRLWAEPETGGESYIPLHPSKRQRSLAIWAETGKHLGVEGFADGGFTDKMIERLISGAGIGQRGLTFGDNVFDSRAQNFRDMPGGREHAHKPFWINPFRDDLRRGASSDDMRERQRQQELKAQIQDDNARMAELQKEVNQKRKGANAGDNSWADLRDAEKRLKEFENEASQRIAKQEQDRLIAIREEQERREENERSLKFEKMSTREQIAELEKRQRAHSRYTDEWTDLEQQRRRLIEEEEQALASFADSFGPITEKMELEWGNSTQALISNLRDQREKIEEHSGLLDSLQGRGISDDLIDALGLDEATNLNQARILADADDSEIAALIREFERRQGAIGDSFNAQTYDVGGQLPPGLTMAYNGTRQAEYVLRASDRSGSSGDSAPVTVVVENEIDGEVISTKTTRAQARGNREIRVRAGKGGWRK